MPRSVLRVGTRSSALALAQAESVRQAISKVITHRSFELVPVVPEGDTIDGPLPDNARALFVRDIQDALAAGKIDLAVHNAENLPAAPPEGVSLGAIPKREDPRDAVITRAGGGLASLPIGAKVGVSALGQIVQLSAVGKGLVSVPLRGAIDARMRRLTEGEVNAVVLSVAALKRLDRADRASEILPVNVMLPVPGQGILAIECRTNDKMMRGALAQLEDADSRAAFEAERSFVLALGGGRDLPVGALAESRDGTVRVRGLIGRLDGRSVLVEQVEGTDPEKVGIELADRLRARGADDVIESF